MSDQDHQALKAFALNCSLRSSSSDEPSSTDRMIEDLLAAMRPHGVLGDVERVADHNVKAGVLSAMGEARLSPEGVKRYRSIPEASIHPSAARRSTSS